MSDMAEPSNDEFFYQKGQLKLKASSKKKKKKTEEYKKIETVIKAPAPIAKTAAEKKFEERKLEKLEERAMEKAKKTHRQRVEDFNKYLDTISEYYDIQKVSWTK